MRLFILILASLGFMAVPRLLGPEGPTIGVQSAADRFATGSKSFAASCTTLRKALEALKTTTASLTSNSPASASTPAASIPTRQAIQLARQRLIECRYHYKQIESFLEYFFRSSASIYNKPPKYEPEEPDMEYQPPAGLQLIESLLYEKHPDQKALLEQIKAVESAASDLPALLYEFKATDRQLLESLRIELVRIIALDITGYEAPLLKSGIQESLIALQSFSSQLQPYLQQGDPRSDSLRHYIEKTVALLQASKDFDSFDRLAFLKQAALPLQRQLALFIHENDLYLNTSKALDYNAGDIFNPDILKPAPSGDGTSAPADPATINLGRQLFFNTALSTNHQKSCASCHDPSKYFTDGRTKSLAFDNHHSLDRNAPSLIYSAWQYSQFWDGRAHTLEEQIRTVLHDAREMNADTTNLQKLGGTEQAITALAAYIRSLHPMNSRFDQYIRNNAPDNAPTNTQSSAPQSNTPTSPQAHASTLTPREISGANLFMGKAQCATCHFIPLFNGLIPPYYELTEFEILGTTTTDKFARKSPLHLSPDVGRYSVYPLPFLHGAFKTPTVRNSANTAPYMHNGAFQSLETVLDFYNKGGGAGLGLSVPDQTLSPTPLNLSNTEIADIILFIHTLTDNLNEKP